jgi:hypothetical protein
VAGREPDARTGDHRMTTTLYEKTLQLIDAEVEMEGAFSAVVASFGAEPDRQGDVIHRGAFTASLARWRASGQRIPVVWSHQAGDPSMVIGSAEPVKSHETSEGLLLVGKLNVFDAPTAVRLQDRVQPPAPRRTRPARTRSRRGRPNRLPGQSGHADSIGQEPGARPARAARAEPHGIGSPARLGRAAWRRSPRRESLPPLHPNCSCVAS